MWDETNQNIRILIVEDAPFLRHAFVRLLRLHGFEVMEAINGREALERVHDFRPDLVVTDLMMPELDGVELIRRLRGDPRTSNLPILAITADPSGTTEQRARQAGAADFLTKPVDMPALLNRLHAFRAE
jgi:CheY-like chemotaxis protein